MRELTLAPKETYDLTVTANLDDTIVNKDEIHIIVEEGDNVMVPLSALGIGTTIHCNQELSVIDMGYQLTNTIWEKRIMLEDQPNIPPVDLHIGLFDTIEKNRAFGGIYKTAYQL